ncbi:HAD family hydrolase [Peptoniphilus mikwangii]|uniref:HAD family hydrolase n=1 Tax=Peptoniphilus mikwangii TaxID=1354300 RepID=UPI0003FE11F6|nr:HAD family hydrolase [Peptoniphilus mikwangii]
MKKQILLFDFDKTLTRKDSILILWEYAVKIDKISKLYFYKNIISSMNSYLIIKDRITFKNKICSVLNYFSESELEKFAEYVYTNYMLTDGIKYFNSLDRDYAMLVSASPITYLKYFKKYLNFDIIIGTELDENFLLKGENNRFTEKVKRINNHLTNLGYEIDYDNSCAFSDSYSSDRPMLEMVKNRYLINSNKKFNGYNNLTWK